MKRLLFCSLALLLGGCKAMELVSTGMNIADDVQTSKDVVHKGVVESSDSRVSQTDIRFQDGARYTVKGDHAYSRGTIVRILKDGDGFRVAMNALDKNLIASGQVTRVDHRAQGSVVFFENGSSYEVIGDPELAIGSRAVIEKDPSGAGYRARQDSY